MTNNSRRSSLGWIITVPCTSKKALRTNSQKGIGEMLNTKLATIVEEPENFYEGNTPKNNINTKINNNISNMKVWFKGKKAKDLARSSKLFKRSKFQIVSHSFCVKGSYINFLAGFVAKGSLIGLPRY
ncbi:putative asparagine--tRNA ligase cytoplasmic [Bienertia sinuspersici]